MFGRIMNEISEVTYLNDYKPSSILIKSVHLTVKLAPQSTKVIAKILFSPQKNHRALELDGTDLKLKKVAINGFNVSIKSLLFRPNGITIPEDMTPKTDFWWEAETIISPEKNTSLDGLYLSSNTFCTS